MWASNTLTTIVKWSLRQSNNMDSRCMPRQKPFATIVKWCCGNHTRWTAHMRQTPFATIVSGPCGSPARRGSGSMRQNFATIVKWSLQRSNEMVALKYASQTLCDDREVVIAAIQNDGVAWDYGSDRLRNIVISPLRCCTE